MADRQPHILVVDDHQDIREPLAAYLTRNGLQVSTAANGKELDEVLDRSEIDLIVLDILMPGESGLDICRRIRESRGIPTILLTAVTEDADRIVGLELGADDYVTKPFNPRELLARIKAILRRASAIPQQSKLTAATSIVFAEWRLRVATHTLESLTTQEELPLSTTEYKLLMSFLSSPKVVLSREQLLRMVSNRPTDVFDRTIDNQVSRLRKKIESNPKESKLIKTVWGGGYMFTADVAKE